MDEKTKQEKQKFLSKLRSVCRSHVNRIIKDELDEYKENTKEKYNLDINTQKKLDQVILDTLKVNAHAKKSIRATFTEMKDLVKGIKEQTAEAIMDETAKDKNEYEDILDSFDFDIDDDILQDLKADLEHMDDDDDEEDSEDEEEDDDMKEHGNESIDIEEKTITQAEEAAEEYINYNQRAAMIILCSIANRLDIKNDHEETFGAWMEHQTKESMQDIFDAVDKKSYDSDDRRLYDDDMYKLFELTKMTQVYLESEEYEDDTITTEIDAGIQADIVPIEAPDLETSSTDAHIPECRETLDSIQRCIDDMHQYSHEESVHPDIMQVKYYVQAVLQVWAQAEIDENDFVSAVGFWLEDCPIDLDKMGDIIVLLLINKCPQEYSKIMNNLCQITDRII